MAGEFLADWQGAVDDRINFGKNAYLEAIPDLAYSIDSAKTIGGIQSRASLDQAMLASGLAKRRGTFDGMEDKYAADAMGYNSDSRKEQAASTASADVAQGFGKMRGQNERQMARMGVNPNSGKFAAMEGQTGIEMAKASAGAENKARQDVDAVADAKQKTAIGFGTNLANQASQASQSSGYAGNAALASTSQPLTDRLKFAGGVSNIYGNGIDDYSKLWGTSNLTAAQQAGIDTKQAEISSGESNAAWGAAGALLGSKTGQSVVETGLDYLKNLWK